MNVNDILSMKDGSIQDYHLIVKIALFCLQNRNENINKELAQKIDPKFLYSGLHSIELKPIECEDTEGYKVKDASLCITEMVNEVKKNVINEILDMYVPDGNPEIWKKKIEKLKNKT